MARYAKGKKAQAISDRSGFKVPYKDLKTTWDGLRVEPQEFEPKHPQLDPPKNVVDATSLFKPRPDNDPINIRIDLAFNWFNNNLTGTTMNAKAYEKPNVGISGIGGIGKFVLSASETDTVGVAGTGAVASVGEFGISVSVVETGLAGTGAIGTEAINLGGWSQNSYGGGSYGDT